MCTICFSFSQAFESIDGNIVLNKDGIKENYRHRIEGSSLYLNLSAMEGIQSDMECTKQSYMIMLESLGSHTGKEKNDDKKSKLLEVIEKSQCKL